MFLARFTALSSKMIDRIFSGAVTRGSSQSKMAKFVNGSSTSSGGAGGGGNSSSTGSSSNHPRMSYTEFVWFLISEEDKRHPTAIEYWFRWISFKGESLNHPRTILEPSLNHPWTILGRSLDGPWTWFQNHQSNSALGLQNGWGSFAFERIPKGSLLGGLTWK